ncbi:hypothetical protein [Paenibacillus sp. FSL R7-0652]|jgi:hypothetical protein|uniref:SMODS and SLOG-associating 2TM effector domain-containing protein n=1 Tax=Paenibacillus sp. AN1007 TaxID=3151385 RepID=A0AAU8ND82_9BACL
MADYDEYTGRVSVTLSELSQMVKVQKLMREGAEKVHSQSKLKEHLESLGITTGTFIAMFGKIPALKGLAGAAAIAYSIYSWVDNFVKPFRLEKLLRAAEANLNDHLVWFSKNASKYKRIEFEAAYLEYFFGSATGTRESIRYMQQAAKIDRIQLNDGTWMSAS